MCTHTRYMYLSSCQLHDQEKLNADVKHDPPPLAPTFLFNIFNDNNIQNKYHERH